MKNRKQNRLAILLFTLVFLISSTVVAFGAQSVVYTTNGAANKYVAGSVLVLYGKVEDGGSAIPGTSVIVDIKDSEQKVIYYGQLKTDRYGYFKTNFTIPAGVTGSMNVKINTTEGNKVDVSYSLDNSGTFEFIGYVPAGYQEGETVQRISASTSRLGLVFNSNVNYFNNRNTNLGLDSLGINERNRDCLDLYKKNNQGNYVLVPSTVEMVSSDTTGNDVVSGVTYIPNPIEEKNVRKDILYLVPTNGLEVGTTYKVVIDGDLSANSSATLGKNVEVYFTTYSSSSSGGTTTLPVTTGSGIITPSGVTFADIQNHWGKTAIEEMAEKGILKGVSANEFAPDRSITRAEFAVLLSRVLKLNQTGLVNEFDDVSDTAWYKNEVSQVAEEDIILGNLGQFRPDEKISRQELALMLARAYIFAGGNALNNAEVAYVDRAAISEWAYRGVAQVSALKMMGGYPNGTFGGTNSTTRAEAAITLKAFLDTLEL